MNNYFKYGLFAYLTYEVIVFLLGIPLMIQVYLTTLEKFQ